MGKKLSFGLGGKAPMAEPGVIPDSRTLNDPQAPEFPTELVGLHFNGVPAEDFPASAWHNLHVSKSDEAIAARDEGKVPFGSGATVSPVVDRGPDTVPVANLDDSDKAAAQRFDFRMEYAEQSVAPDPLAQVARAHLPSGWRPRFMSATNRIPVNGYIDGYKVILDEKGQPVRHGDVLLCGMPEEFAKARVARLETQAKEAVQEITRPPAKNPGSEEPGFHAVSADEQADTKRALKVF